MLQEYNLATEQVSLRLVRLPLGPLQHCISSQPNFNLIKVLETAHVSGCLATVLKQLKQMEEADVVAWIEQDIRGGRGTLQKEHESPLE